MLSNIAASQSDHVKALVDKDIFIRLIQICLSKNIDNRKEALWVLTNSITGADTDTRVRIFNSQNNIYDVVRSLVEGLMVQDNRLLMNVLEAVDAMLRLDNEAGFANTDNAMVFLFETQKGLDALEEVQKNPNKAVYDYSVLILNKYFDTEDQPMDTGAQNNGGANGHSTFNI